MLGATADELAQDGPLSKREDGEPRTPGGVFFRVVRAKVGPSPSPAWYRVLCNGATRQRKRRQAAALREAETTNPATLPLGLTPENAPAFAA